MQLRQVSELAKRAIDAVAQVIVGKDEVLRQVLMGILSDGHVLIQDNPGLAKTLIAHSFSEVLDIAFSRIQFTPDLLPGEITGGYIYNQREAQFEFRRGPLFAHLLLGDEINRATPKTQSALLEAMQERQVTVEGERFPLDPPFIVIATQNPVEFEGTYPLPEAQLDRFLFNVVLDYLTTEQEMDVVNRNTTAGLPEVDACTTVEEILEFQKLVRQVPVSEETIRYAVNFIRATRPKDPESTEMIRKYVNYGASVRSTQFLVMAAKARALMQGRYHVTIEDLHSLVLPVLRHRILSNFHAESDGVTTDDILKNLIAEKPETRT